MKTNKGKCKNSSIVFWVILLFPVCQGFSQEIAGLARSKIAFKGNAKGGILTICEVTNRNCRYVSISTKQGESSESVATRLADTINLTDPFDWRNGMIQGKDKPLSFITNAGAVTFLGGPGTYACAGTETGLGIPEPPTSLSGQYDEEFNIIILNWQNAKSGYDEINIVSDGSCIDGFPYRNSVTIPGTRQMYFTELRDRKIKYANVCVIGIRDGIPSGTAAIYLSGNSQEELFGIPFINEVAPNWQAWSLNAMPNKDFIKSQTNYSLIFAKGRSYNPIKNPDAKPFKQVLNTSAEGGTVGIWRKFIGLTPGHTYRLSARLNTRDMKPNEQGWSFSMHAIPDNNGIDKLTAKQMAGLEALPNSIAGQKADRLKVLDPENLTGGEYNKYSADISLPQNSNSIMVWLRLASTGEAKVSFDWIKLEDITAIKSQ